MTRIINRLFRSTWFPLSIQLIMLAAFLLLIIGGFLANTGDMAFAKVLRNTNLANLIVWSYWWPLIILSAVFLGRVWCALCPMELLTSLASRIGLRRRPPAFFRSGWAITTFYILILFVGIHMLAIHRVPLRMALYMLLLLATAIVSGLLFSRNAFCAYICPVGHLLGLYARLAPMGWRVANPELCAHCKDLSCISEKTAYAFQGRSCGVGLQPGKLDDNTQCLLCGQCLKACDRHNPGLEGRPNPGWHRRRWFKDILNLEPLTAAQVGFCMVVSGFVVYEVLTEWSATKTLLLWIPSRLEAALDVTGAVGHGLVTSLLIFVALPVLLWMLPLGLYRLVGGRLETGLYLKRFGIAFVPIMAAAHVTKAVLKTTSRISYWAYTASDPVGVTTAKAIIDKNIRLAPSPVWRDPLISIVSLSAMAVGLTLSVLVVRKLTTALLADRGLESAALYLIPGLYGGVFFLMFVVWRLF